MNRGCLTGQITTKPQPRYTASGELTLSFWLDIHQDSRIDKIWVKTSGDLAEFLRESALTTIGIPLIVIGSVSLDDGRTTLTASVISHNLYHTWKADRANG